MIFNNVPTEMRQSPQWAVFRIYTDSEGKKKKIIISPNNSNFAKCNDSKTWSDYETAKRFCIINGYKGLVFALTSGITFIDIDHAIDKATGEILSEEAKQLMKQLQDTYTEKSVSGTGIHILVKGSLPENARNRNDKKGLEMYDRNRFVCITGDILSNTKILKDYSGIIPDLNKNFIGVRPEPITITHNGNIWSPSDEQLVEKIRASKVGHRFNELYNGLIGSSDHSSADFALCSMLAWWTQDAIQIDRIFRNSGLYRPKWDSSRGNTTYGALTIEHALQGQSSRYEPRTHPKIIYSTQSEM